MTWQLPNTHPFLTYYEKHAHHERFHTAPWCANRPMKAALHSPFLDLLWETCPLLMLAYCSTGPWCTNHAMTAAYNLAFLDILWETWSIIITRLPITHQRYYGSCPALILSWHQNTVRCRMHHFSCPIPILNLLLESHDIHRIAALAG